MAIDIPSMINEIQKLRYLPERDKRILLDYLASDFGQGSYMAGQDSLRSLSVFKQDAKYRNLNAFEYDEYDEDDLYFISSFGEANLSLFFDKHKRIVFFSRYYLTHLNEFVQKIDVISQKLQEIDLSKAIDIGQNFVAIGKWFNSYGHIQDEFYSLKSFITMLPGAHKFRALLDYPTSTTVNPHACHDGGVQYYPENFERIDRLVFGDQSINAFQHGATPLKLRNLIIVRNQDSSSCFHSFPRRVSADVRSKALATEPIHKAAIEKHRKIFLTRSDSYRDVSNKTAVEEKFASAGFQVINPESIKIEDLIHILDASRFAVFFYGSAMTNLIYLNPECKAWILQSQSYAHESFDLWKKMIAGHQLDISVIPSVDNTVTDETIAQIISCAA